MTDVRVDRKIHTADSDALIGEAVHSDPRRMIRVLLIAKSVVVAGRKVADANNLAMLLLLDTLRIAEVFRKKRWMPKGWWEARE